jgi:hypothetical protein
MGNKDSQHDIFSATFKLMRNTKLPFTEADDLVFTDFNMVPLMVQEGYLAASRSLEEAVAASEEISHGDHFSHLLWKTQDWSLLPHVVHTTVAAARLVSGSAPFPLFPQILGRNSKRGKHRRILEDVGRALQLSAANTRLDKAEPLQRILLRPLTRIAGEKKDLPVIQGVIGRLDAVGMTRDHLMDLPLFSPVELVTKVKSALTREYNKGHTVIQVREEEEEEEEPI